MQINSSKSKYINLILKSKNKNKLIRLKQKIIEVNSNYILTIVNRIFPVRLARRSFKHQKIREIEANLGLCFSWSGDQLREMTVWLLNRERVRNNILSQPTI